MLGSHILDGVHITDSDGQVLSLTNSESIQFMILQELRAIRLMLTDITDSHIDDQDINDLID
jgi:hypothetical protein